MIYRKCVLLLLQLSLVLSDDVRSGKDRAKRLATPNFNIEVVETMSKYVASIRTRMPFKYVGDNHFCGGTIVSSIFVLTAANCVMDMYKIMYPTRFLLVVVGAPDRLRLVAHQSLNLPVKQIFVPENYIVFNTNNLALLKMDNRLPSNNEHIGIIKLPSKPPIYGIMYTVLGWGRVYEGGPLASNILFIDVLLQERSYCETMVKPFLPGMMCAGNFNSSENEATCPGDTGAPLLINETIYGVATYGIGCGKRRLPSVYSNVWHNMKWITEVMDKNCCQKCTQLPVFIYMYITFVLFHTILDFLKLWDNIC